MKLKRDAMLRTLWEVTLDEVVRGRLTEEVTFKLRPT